MKENMLNLLAFSLSYLCICIQTGEVKEKQGILWVSLCYIVSVHLFFQRENLFNWKSIHSDSD